MFWFKKKTPQPGTVYLGESTRQNGAKQIYTGVTRRPVWKRWREHMAGRGGGYTSSGTSFRPLAAFRSSNPFKAERTIKRWGSGKKRWFAGVMARRYRNSNRRGFW